MNRLQIIVTCLVFVAAVSAVADSQVVDSSVCDVLANPVAFDGKVVRMKGTAVAGFDEFVIDGSSCKPGGAIWLAYPEGTKAKAGPAAMVRLQLARNTDVLPEQQRRIGVTLLKDGNFSRFDSLLSTPAKVPTCLACPRYRVAATFVGRIDGVSRPGVARSDKGKVIGLAGFGNANLYSARLVLQSVADVAPEEIDYSKDGSPRGDSRRISGADAASLARRGAAAFGEPGEDNGVAVEFGVANEVAPDDGAKGRGASPDGLLFHVTVDMNRLGKENLGRAIAHAGTHIADIRGGVSMSDLAEAESRAWRATFVK